MLSRISLCDDFYANYKNDGFVHYQKHEQSSTNKTKWGDRLIVCVNSLEKFISSGQTFDLMLIDESESLLKHCVEQNLRGIYYNIVKFAANQCKKLVFLDYAFGDLTLQLTKGILACRKTKSEKPNFLIINKYKDESKKTELINEQTFYERLVQYAIEGKKLFVGCDTKTNVEFLRDFLTSSGVPSEEIMVVHSEEKNQDMIQNG